MRPRQTAGGSPVSLFPFLAVLMCMMGSLILLLVVTSRQIRERAQAVADRSEPAPPQPPPPARPRIARAQPAPPAIDPADLVPLLPELADDPGPTLEDGRRREAALRSEWSGRVDDLNRQLAEARRALAAEQQKADDDRTTWERLSREQAKLHTRGEQLDRQKKELADAQDRLLAQRAQVAASLSELEQLLNSLRNARAEASSRFAMVAYEGASGTVRQPIVLECTADRIAFAGEHVAITAAELSGFSPAFNPLRMGAAALAAAVERSKGNAANASVRPYILFIVRPDGTEAYYVARALLGDLPIASGVELVTDDMEFTWPEADPDAVLALRDAIDRALSQRARIFGRIGSKPGGGRGVGAPGSSDSESVGNLAAPNGDFHLPDIDETRPKADERQVFFGDRQVARQTASPSRSQSPDMPAGLTPLRQTPPPKLNPAPDANPSDSRVNTPAAPPTPPAIASQSGAAERGERRPPADRTGPRESSRPAGGGPNDPDPPFLRSSSKGRPSAEAAKTTKHWGESNPLARIGFERDVTFDVYGDRMTGTPELGVLLAPDASREAVEQAFETMIDSSTRGWGPPPTSFFWMPHVTLRVHPGGNVHSARLKGLAEGWGLRVTLEQRLE